MANNVDGSRDASYYTRRYLQQVANAGGVTSRSAMERSRERRRRRMMLRRNAALAVADVASLNLGGGAADEEEGSVVVVGFPVAAPAGFPWAAPPLRAVPVVGAVSIEGRMRGMEDAVTVHTSLCSPAMGRFRPVHYFAVFDGHGGSHFSAMCREQMHGILKEELMAMPAAPGQGNDEAWLLEAWKTVLGRCFSRTEMAALHTCVCGSVGFQCHCDPRAAAFCGTTAVVVLLTEDHIVVGNCGDSRAVLYRANADVPISFDHKPLRADEMARIEACGGRIIQTDTARVEGILAMTRAIGDAYLKPSVISEPEVTLTRRTTDDQYIIMASDGMWDVMTTRYGGRVTRECLIERWTPGAEGGYRVPLPENHVLPAGSRSAFAAALLTRLALARMSGDNISVVVVDLKRASMVDANNSNAVIQRLWG